MRLSRILAAMLLSMNAGCASQTPPASGINVPGVAETSVTFDGPLVNCLAADPSGDRVALGIADNTIRIYDFREGRFVATLGSPRTVYYWSNGPSGILTLSFTADGSTLWAGGRDLVDRGAVRRWNLQTNAEVNPYIPDQTGTVEAITVAPPMSHRGGIFQSSADRLAVVASERTNAGGAIKVRVLDIQTFAAENVFKGTDNALATAQVIAISQSGKRIAVGSGVKDVAVYDVDTGKRLAGVESPEKAWQLVLSPDSESVFWVDESGRVYGLAVKPGAQLRTSPESLAYDGRLLVSSDGKRLFGWSGEKLLTWRINGGDFTLESKRRTPSDTPWGRGTTRQAADDVTSRVMFRDLVEIKGGMLIGCSVWYHGYESHSVTRTLLNPGTTPY